MSPSAPDSANPATEKILWVAIWGNLALAGLGLLFGLGTRSHVILLDGVLSGLNSLIAVMARQVNHRLAQPQSDRLPFADAALEPLLEVLRGAVSVVVYGFAGLAAIAALGSGGRTVRAAFAVLYGAVVALGGMILANYQGKQVQDDAEPSSPSLSLGAVDARHWFIEGTMGLAIALVFGVVFMAGDTDQAQALLAYVDPLFVLGVVWLSVRTPWGWAKQGWFEMLERSADRRLQQRIRKLLDRPIRLIPHESEVLRVGRFGRVIYIQLYLIVSPQNELTRQVLAHDRIRQLMYDHLNEALSDAFALEVVITSDRRWAERAIGEIQSPP
ncbi:cation transporter [Sodalinema gerasimenkoae]|uniref:cation transporter n=1 Tax=Sodalinema gerasimenkoae TaxID=2862348 RepID=UPI001359284C|nr:cation transporter [Sodalinema gerasimenkoae]